MPFVIGIEGPYGTGKTLTGVIKALQWSKRSGANIFANFPMREAYLFDHYTDWYRVADLHGSIVIFDESQRNWDARRWNGNGQIDQTQVMNYVRKMNCIFIFILPSFQDVDSRVRKMTEILIRCFKTPSGTIINNIFDYQAKEYGEYGKWLNRWILPKESQKKVFELGIYDTYSMVHDFPMPAPAQSKKFFVELDRRHELALNRVKPDRVVIETMVKEELENAASAS